MVIKFQINKLFNPIPLFTTGHFLYYEGTSSHSRMFLVVDAPWRAGISSILIKWMPDRSIRA